MFDWEVFLQRERVPYISEGKNVSYGNINVKCPLCPDDPSEHMGINPITGKWGCWRNNDHKGRTPYRLVAALLGITGAEANRLIREYTEGDPPAPAESLAEMKKQLDSIGKKKKHEIDPMSLLEEFHDIDDRTGVSRRFLNLLAAKSPAGRGFGGYAEEVASYYGLRYCVSGEWAWRIIIPFWFKKKLVGWTGRDISAGSSLRYKNEPPGQVTKLIVFNYDNAMAEKNKRALVVVEGPFDCIKQDFSSKRLGVRAIGTLGTRFTDEQINHIITVAELYPYTIVLFDPKAESEALALYNHLAVAKSRVLIDNVPDGYEDPGAFTRKKAKQLARLWRRGKTVS